MRDMVRDMENFWEMDDIVLCVDCKDLTFYICRKNGEYKLNY